MSSSTTQTLPIFKWLMLSLGAVSAIAGVAALLRLRGSSSAESDDDDGVAIGI